MGKRRLRPVGDVLTDLEPFLLELGVTHALQHGEILNLVRGYLEIHIPGGVEEYEDGSKPIFFYGSTEGLK